MNHAAREDWVDLIPHRDRMSLLDEVVAWDEVAIHARSQTHRRNDHPLRSSEGLHAVHLIEYAAQATAVHGALLARSRGEPALAAGRLVSLREVEVAMEWVDQVNGCLDIHAEQVAGSREGAHYQFRVLAAGTSLVAGRMAVMYGPAA